MVAIATLGALGLGFAACGGSPKVLGSHAGFALEIRHNDGHKRPCAQGSGSHPAEVPVGTIVAGFRKLGLTSIERLAANVKLGFADLKARTAICIVRKTDGEPVAAPRRAAS